MMDDIQGDLVGGITCEFKRGPNIGGNFTLSLDEKRKTLSIEYNFTLKFVGSVKDKLVLFPLPAHVFFLDLSSKQLIDS